MICSSCDCGCLVLPFSCLYKKQQRLKRFKIDQYPEILNAVNNFKLIGEEDGGILGNDCFNALCSEIIKAEAFAADYREANIGATGEETEFWFYLPANWKELLNNGYFQNAYATYCMYYYYYLGIAASETSADGDYQHNRSGSSNDGDGGKNITEAESSKKAQIHLSLADKYARLFQENYLHKNKDKFNCLPKDCHIDNHCNDYLKDNYCNCNKSTCSTCNHVKEHKIIKKVRSTWL